MSYKISNILLCLGIAVKLYNSTNAFMSDDELDWQKNVKPMECEKVTLKVDHKINIKSMVNKGTFDLRENFLNTNNRPLAEPVYDGEFLGKVQISTTEYSNVFEEHRQALTTKLPSEIKLCKRSNVSLSFCLDYNTKSKIDRGKYFISDKLDLHGYNVEDAYCKLIDFIIKNYQAGNRCLLIITGHGNVTDKTDTIKNNLNKWLNDTKIQHIVLYHQQATKEHGGKGAFYVLLRRNKDLRPKTRTCLLDTTFS